MEFLVQAHTCRYTSGCGRGKKKDGNAEQAPKGETEDTRATGFGLTVCCLLDGKCTKGMYLLEVRRGAAAYWWLGFPPTCGPRERRIHPFCLKPRVLYSKSRQANVALLCRWSDLVAVPKPRCSGAFSPDFQRGGKSTFPFLFCPVQNKYLHITGGPSINVQLSGRAGLKARFIASFTPSPTFFYSFFKRRPTAY